MRKWFDCESMIRKATIIGDGGMGCVLCDAALCENGIDTTCVGS